MNIVVCVKVVPHVIGSVKLKDNRKDIIREEFVYKINDIDDNALEEALLLKDKFGGKVTVITLSPREEQDSAGQILWECIAKGADRVIHLVDELFVGIDSYITARLLAEVIRHMPYDLILTGSQALDDNLGHVGPMLAEFLGIPYATLIVKMEVGTKKVLAWMELDEGYKQVVELTLPALIAVQSGINEPRYVSLSRIRMARNKPIGVVNAKDINASEELILNWRKFEIKNLSIVEKKKTQFINGNLNEITLRLAELISKFYGS